MWLEMEPIGIILCTSLKTLHFHKFEIWIFILYSLIHFDCRNTYFKPSSIK